MEFDSGNIKRKVNKLIRYLILVILDHVVGPGAEIEEGAADDAEHEGGRLLVRGVGGKARAQQADSLPAEARQTRVQHQ